MQLITPFLYQYEPQDILIFVAELYSAKNGYCRLRTVFVPGIDVGDENQPVTSLLQQVTSTKITSQPSDSNLDFKSLKFI